MYLVRSHPGPNFDPYHNGKDRKLWHPYQVDKTEGPDVQRTWITERAGRGRTLAIRVTQGNLYLYCLNHDDAASKWHMLSDLMPQWQPATYNRLRIWLRTPKGLRHWTDGGFNFHVGTFTRNRTERYAQETGNGHWYYYHNLFPGRWNRIDVDLDHPHHKRDQPTKEWGLIESPTGNPQRWMADALTSFYLDAKAGHGDLNLKYYPANYYLGAVEFVKAPTTDPAMNIYGVTSAYDGKRKLQLSWSVNREKVDRMVHLRWSSQPIRGFGGANLIKGGNCLLAPGHDYNGMTWQGFADFWRYPVIYVAIKLEGSPGFRQIKIDTR